MREPLLKEIPLVGKIITKAEISEYGDNGICLTFHEGSTLNVSYSEPYGCVLYKEKDNDEETNIDMQED